jgi:hypothetical protein
VHPDTAPPEEPPRRRKGGLWFGAAVVLAVAVGAAGVVVREEETGGSAVRPQAPVGNPVDSGPSPTSYSHSPSAAAYAAIAERRADAAPLTEAESFPRAARTIRVEETGARLTLRADSVEGDCGQAVWGDSVATELRRGGCNQAVRGLYADVKRGYLLTVAVFNLAAAADANRLVESLDAERGAGFVRPLPGEKPLDKPWEGFSMARGLAMGHYAVITWTRRLDGAGDAQDRGLLALLIEGGKAPGPLGRAARATPGKR